ncbi:MAG: hypothetical protein M1823_000644 [Watsoniomyces obsoletus]|nr:MAG: hypothetical protein M1823_000644 [Watsoniomyces obsoletus]
MAPSMDHAAPYSDDDSDSRPSKRRRIVHHYIHHKQEVPNNEILPESAVHDLLDRAIVMGFAAVEGVDAVTRMGLEQCRESVEKYILDLLEQVRVSMLSCRRTIPIPQDFSWALKYRGLSLSDLVPHLQPMAPPSMALPPLEIAPPSHEIPPAESFAPLLGLKLSGQSDKEKRKFIPKFFPSFPGKHTYKFTPVKPPPKPHRELVRERAILEARKGEQAYWNLLTNLERSAAEAEEERLAQGQGRKRRRGRRAILEAVWRKAMGNLKEEEKEGEPTYGGIINYEQRFWRKIPEVKKVEDKDKDEEGPREGDAGNGGSNNASNGNDVAGTFDGDGRYPATDRKYN